MVVGSVALGLVAGLIVAVVAFIVVLANLASGSDPQSMGEGAAHGGYIVIAAGFWAVVAGVLAAIVATAASALLIIKLRRS